MKFVTIKGRLSGLGDNAKTSGAHTTYDYISVTKEDGSEVHIRDIRVHDMVNHVLIGSIGQTGTIILSKTAFDRREMHVAAFNGAVGGDLLAQGNMSKIYVSYSMLLLISFLQSLIIIGIPNLVRLLWGVLTVGGARQRLVARMEEADIPINQALQLI